MRGGVARLAALLLVLCACARGSSPTGALDLVRPDDVPIYAVVLDSLFGSSESGAKRVIVLLDSTRASRPEERVPEYWVDVLRSSSMDSSAAEDFARRARTAAPVRSVADELGLHLASTLRLVSASTLRQLPTTGIASPSEVMTSADYFWRAFAAMFPNAVGTVSLSPPGYSRSGDQAVVYVEHGCGSLCGEGRIVWLRRTDGRWRIVRTHGVWVS